MEILRVFNNNVVLAKDRGREVILTGRGLGFKAKPGMTVDDAKVARVFVPAQAVTLTIWPSCWAIFLLKSFVSFPRPWMRLA